MKEEERTFQEHRGDFRKLENGALYASFSSKDRELLVRALMFIRHSFPEQTESTGAETGYTALTMKDPEGGFCTIHAYSSGELAVAADHGTGRFLMSDFTGADVAMQFHGGVLSISMNMKGICTTTCFAWTLAVGLNVGDVRQIASSFREVFSE